MNIVSAIRNHAGSVICALAIVDQRDFPSGGSTERGRRCEGGVSLGARATSHLKSVALRYQGHNWSKAQRIIFASVRWPQFPCPPSSPRSPPEIDYSAKLELCLAPEHKASETSPLSVPEQPDLGQ